MEIWKPIKNWESQYEVSNLGRVRGIDRDIYFRNGWGPYHVKGGIIKSFPTCHGYLKVTFNKNSKKYNRTVHRLVAETFISNPENKPHVNHIDGDKTNNNVVNLEWVTRVENMRHCHEVLKKGSRPKRPIRCIETGETYESLHEAARQTGVRLKNLPRGLKTGIRVSGYHWEYV